MKEQAEIFGKTFHVLDENERTELIVSVARAALDCIYHKACKTLDEQLFH